MFPCASYEPAYLQLLLSFSPGAGPAACQVPTACQLELETTADELGKLFCCCKTVVFPVKRFSDLLRPVKVELKAFYNGEFVRNFVHGSAVMGEVVALAVFADIAVYI